MKRNIRAELALVVSLFSGFFFLDALVYGSQVGYNLAGALSVALGSLGVAVALFAWNVATYKK